MNATLSQRLWLAGDNTNLVKKAVMVAAGVAALAVSAKTQVPFGLVPGTLQLLVVLALGAAYGSRMGFATVFAYLAAGFMGAPVFALGAAAGPAYFLGVTGGYLIGFLVAATIVGLLAERGMDRNFATMAIAMLAGVLITHAFGSGWLLALAQPENAINWFKAFIMFDLAKVIVAVIAFPVIWKWIGEAR